MILLLAIVLGGGIILSVVHGVQVTLGNEPEPDEPDTRGRGSAVALVLLALFGAMAMLALMSGVTVTSGVTP